MTDVLSPPAAASGRLQATELFRRLPKDLSGVVLRIQFAHMELFTPSFVDELVKVALVERSARRLVAMNAGPLVHELLERSAADRDVTTRLVFETSDVEPARRRFWSWLGGARR